MEITSNLVIAVIAGVVGSVIALVGDRALHERKLRKKYVGLEGEYEHFDANGQKRADWITSIKYAGDGVLNTEAWSNDLARKWRGHIVMSEAIPYWGEGVWQHLDNSECGSHSIQVDSLHRQIFVYWKHRSDPKGEPGQGAVVWRRRGD